MTEESTPRPRGLARLSPERRREIARMGGRASTGGFRGMSPAQRRQAASTGGQHAHSNGHPNEWRHEEARQAVRRRKWHPIRGQPAAS